MFKSDPKSIDRRPRVPGRTLRAPVRVTGRGLHSGRPVTVELRPRQAPGICFEVSGARVPVHVDLASAPGGRTRLQSGEVHVDTPEHLLAAVAGLGITHLDIVPSGPELPALDGSAQEWVHALETDGALVSVGSVSAWAVSKPLVVEAFGGVARAWPSDTLQIAVDVDFGPTVRGPAAQGRFALEVTPAAFREQLAWARTFLPHTTLDAVLDAGLGRGVDPGAVVVLGARGPLVPVRSADECVRHKALDLLGDLALVGAPVLGRFEVERGTHALHQALVRAVIEAPGPPPPRSG